ncbi:tryptophan-rich sensory protein [Clostridium sediminicola]|uniref:tryptophan-rich sensory protein n=1 Tax=Clostridium sediminicola TaxID=3114879 RepID=UPI0031F22A95
MKGKRGITFINVLVVVTYLIMIAVNFLANSIPINGVTTGEVASKYKNLFTPAPITFSIWGLIYLLLAAYTIYQLGFFQKDKSVERDSLLKKIGIFFSISSIANALWILSWHYYKIPSSLLLMIVMLICLIMIVSEINKTDLSCRDKFFIKIPFSVYFGWITIATIANVTTFLVSIGWDGLGISEETWTIIVILLGLLISVITILKNNDFIYGLVIIWAYIGILIKHKSPNGFAGQYPAIITTLIISIGILVIVDIYILKRKSH